MTNTIHIGKIELLKDVFQRNASVYADKTAILNLNGPSLNYAQLWQYSVARGNSLHERGIRQDSRIVVLAPTDPILYALLAASSTLGAVVVPLNAKLSDRELISQVEHAAPDLIVASEKQSQRVAHLTVPVALTEALWKLEKSERGFGYECIQNVDNALLQSYSSGTTGKAKGIMLSERSLTLMASATAKLYDFQSTDVVLNVLPLVYMNPIMMTGLVPLFAGAQITMPEPLDGIASFKGLWPLLERTKATMCSLTPFFMRTLLSLYPNGPEVRPAQLRRVYCGTAPLSPELWRQFEQTFGVEIFQGYGLVETTMWSTFTLTDGSKDYRTVGRPVNCEVRIATVADGSADDEDAAVGEVLIRGPILMNGYYKSPEQTAAVFDHDGFFRTGDLGRFDENGNLVLTGRIKDVIVRMGANVSANEVDDAFRTHPDVLDAKTVGVPHEFFGESVVTVCVVPTERSGGLVETLTTWSQNNLSVHMRPNRIVLAKALPRGIAGKVAIEQVRKLVTGEVARGLVSAVKDVAILSDDETAALNSTVGEALLDGTYATVAMHWTRLLQAPEAHEIRGVSGPAHISCPQLSYSEIWGVDLHVFYNDEQKQSLVYEHDESVFVLDELSRPVSLI